MMFGHWLPISMFNNVDVFISFCRLVHILIIFFFSLHSLWMQGIMSVQNVWAFLEVKIFDVWGIEFMGPFPPSHEK